MAAEISRFDVAPRPSDCPALEVRNLSVSVDTVDGRAKAIDDVSFDVNAGTTLGLVGESGSGKSLTAQSIVGLLDPAATVTGGVAKIEDTNLLALSDSERRAMAGPQLAIVFQDALTALNPVQTVGHQLEEPFRIHEKLSRREARKRALVLMQRVGIPDAESRLRAYPHQLSGGLNQRLLIAMAVALNPRVLIADEPTTALDVTIQAQIMDLLRDLREERNMAVVLITHDLAVLAEHADYVAVMYAGTIVEKGPVSTVFDLPSHPYTQGLLASVPSAGGRESELHSIEGNPPDLHSIPSACVFQDRCPLVQEICRVERPTLRSIDKERIVACHFAKDPVHD